MYLNPDYPILAKLGVVFIPVYTSYALFTYSSQISIATQIQNIAEYKQQSELIDIMLSQLTQAWNKSGIALINNYAYAILGIPSVLFAFAFLDKKRIGKITG